MTYAIIRNITDKFVEINSQKQTLNKKSTMTEEIKFKK